MWIHVGDELIDVIVGVGDWLQRTAPPHRTRCSERSRQENHDEPFFRRRYKTTWTSESMLNFLYRTLSSRSAALSDSVWISKRMFGSDPYGFFLGGRPGITPHMCFRYMSIKLEQPIHKEDNTIFLSENNNDSSPVV